MSDTTYICVVIDYSDNIELTTEFLSAEGFQFSSKIDKEKDEASHTIYSETDEENRLVASRLETLIPEWEQFGIHLSSPKVEEIEKKDWSEEWKKHFDTIHVSKRLVINPSWLDYTAKDEEMVIQLDPGMSFGTGKHATTLFCLRNLDELSADGDQKMSFLDAGCGSGILSIAARKLGYDPICAFDVDPDAVRIACENAEINYIQSDEVDFSTMDLAEAGKMEKTFTVVAANILSHVLVANARVIVSLVQDDGWLILSGILEKEYDSVISNFTKLGCVETKNYIDGEWKSGLFKKGIEQT